jgi:ADP-heptose:LPS heptosyltransferase
MMAHVREFLKYLPVLLKRDRIVLRRISSALGDNLFLSFLAREIKAVSPQTVIAVETKWPELFEGNPYIDVVLKEKVAIRYRKIRYLIDSGTTDHILDQMVAQLPFSIRKWNRKLELYLAEDEFSHLRHELPNHYIVMNPQGKQSHSANRKEWGLDNFQQVRDLLGDNDVIQIGPRDTPLLKNTHDFRGTGIRESAFIISRSLTGVFLEGGLMHVANAVDRPCVIVFGGAVLPAVTGYAMHVNVSRRPWCSPCISSHEKMSICDTMICMLPIQPGDVAQAVKRLAEKARLAKEMPL